MAFLTIAEYLSAIFLALKAQVPKYGYRKFSEDLGFGNNNVAYLLVSGKRAVSKKSAKQIIQALGLTHLKRRYFLQLVAVQKPAIDEVDNEAFEKLTELKKESLPEVESRNQLDFYNEWYHVAILALMYLPDAMDSVEWISGRLVPHVPPLKVKKSLDLLISLGYLKHDPKNKRLVPSQPSFDNGSDIMGLAVVRYHQQMLALAQEAITKVPPEKREIATVTISLAASKMTLLKAKSRDFLNDLLELSQEEKNADQVTQINVQIFPLSQDPNQ